MPLPKVPGDKNAVLLFVHALHIERPVNYRVALFTDEGRRIAETTVRGTSEFFHPWLAWTGENELWDGGPLKGSMNQLIEAMVLPTWRDTAVFRDRRDSLIAHQDERLPTPLPERPDPGFQLRILKDRVILTSDVDLPIWRPDLHLLTRWWVNGNPFSPSRSEGGYRETSILSQRTLRNIDLRLLLQPAQIGAQSGDRVELQILFCGEGRTWLSNDLEMRWHAAADPKGGPPVLLLSNRAAFVVP